MKIIILFLTISMLLAACGTTNNYSPDLPGETNNSTNGNGNTDNDEGNGENGDDKQDKSKEELKENLMDENGEDLASTLEYKKDSFIFTVENNQEADAEIVFSSGKEYDYVVFDQAGKIVKRHSEGMMYTQALKEIILAPGDTLEYFASFEEVTANLAEGDYTIQFIFEDKNFNASSKKEFSVE